MSVAAVRRHGETLGSRDFRSNFTAFRRMGAAKPAIVERLLTARGLDAVVLSDVDTVWLRDVRPWLRARAAADVLISTDCLSAWVEAEFEPPPAPPPAGHAAAARTGSSPPMYYHRCGHLPGATFGRAFNTGVAIFRNRCCAPLPIHFGSVLCSMTRSSLCLALDVLNIPGSQFQTPTSNNQGGRHSRRRRAHAGQPRTLRCASGGACSRTRPRPSCPALAPATAPRPRRSASRTSSPST